MALETPLDKEIKALILQAPFTPETLNKIPGIAARWNLVRSRALALPLPMGGRRVRGAGWRRPGATLPALDRRAVGEHTLPVSHTFEGD